MRFEKDNEKNNFIYGLLVFILGFALAIGFSNDYFSSKISETAMIASKTYEENQYLKTENKKLITRIEELEVFENLNKDLAKSSTEK